MQWTTWAWERANGDCKYIFLTLFYASLLISVPHSVTITCHVLQRYCSWMSANSLQSWPTLEWVSILSSRGSCWPRDGTYVSCFCQANSFPVSLKRQGTICPHYSYSHSLHPPLFPPFFLVSHTYTEQWILRFRLLFKLLFPMLSHACIYTHICEQFVS